MPLKIQYCSDLHLEFDMNRKWIHKYPLKVTGNILLLGGDIVPFSSLHKHDEFFDFLSQNYESVYWIPGNHEYYHSDINERSGILNEAIRKNVFLVNNTTVEIGNAILICSTLWSKINPAHSWQITRAMSDFHLITDGESSLTIDRFNSLHTESRHFIEQALKDYPAGNRIVLTHHIPTLMHYPEKYRGDFLNQAFATEMHDFIEDSGVNYWIFGHHHCNIPPFRIGATGMLTNQLGYVKYGENINFDLGRIIEI